MLVEAILILPVITIFTAGVLEFGNVLWQRQQLQAGVRDAARYYARCRTSFNVCSEAIARNIAFYATPSPGADTPERVPGWNDPSQIEIYGPTPTAVPTTQIITVRGFNQYVPSPWFSALGVSNVTVEYVHEQRFIGW